jgi:hypothetical protein
MKSLEVGRMQPLYESVSCADFRNSRPCGAKVRSTIEEVGASATISSSRRAVPAE